MRRERDRIAAAPAINAEDEEVAYAVANITVFGILAMLLYPYLANLLFAGNVVMAGLFQGTAIHETAQVTGAALIYDQTFKTLGKSTAADVAIVTKLVRNVLMALVIPLMGYLYMRRSTKGSPEGTKPSVLNLFPLFILGFIGMAIFRSIGDAGIQGGGEALGIWGGSAWSQATGKLSDIAGYALAMAGVGLGTQFSTIKGLG